MMIWGNLIQDTQVNDSIDLSNDNYEKRLADSLIHTNGLEGM